MTIFKLFVQNLSEILSRVENLIFLSIYLDLMISMPWLTIEICWYHGYDLLQSVPIQYKYLNDWMTTASSNCAVLDSFGLAGTRVFFIFINDVVNDTFTGVGNCFSISSSQRSTIFGQYVSLQCPGWRSWSSTWSSSWPWTSSSGWCQSRQPWSKTGYQQITLSKYLHTLS